MQELDSIAQDAKELVNTNADHIARTVTASCLSPLDIFSFPLLTAPLPEPFTAPLPEPFTA
eukprot:1166230-Pleurochrysis_carterae.AAC.1